MLQPIIIHLDMNSYFASVEQQDNLAWRNKPVGVCEHLGGIIIAASVDAKKWGIKTGTPVWEAKKLYPKIILTPTHPDHYRFYTRRMVKVVSDYTAFVEQYSIDEVFLDITKACNVSRPADQPISLSAYQLVNPFEEAIKIAREIKRRFKTEVGDYLTCSVGIAENKLLAKIASDIKKPDGLVVVKDKGLKIKDCLEFTKDDLYHRLKLTDIPGIGRRQEKNLNTLGIKTLLDLKNCPKDRLVGRFGVVGGHHMYNMGQLKASYKPAVHQEEEIKSIGHMYTLPQEFRQPKFFVPVLYKLCEMVARRLRRQELAGNIVHFYFSDKNSYGWGKSKHLNYYAQDGREFFFEAIKMYESQAPKNQILKMSVSFIGITVAGLIPAVRQLSLFGDVEMNQSLLKALDKINDKYGDFTVCRAPVLAAGKVFRDSIGFGRIREK